MISNRRHLSRKPGPPSPSVACGWARVRSARATLNYNDHYHPLLLKQVPYRARTVLDVEGVDADADVIEAARAAGGGPRYRQTDVRQAQLPDSHYDFICASPVPTTVPFDTVLTLRKALAPGGVLAVLGLYPVKTATDLAWALPALSLLRANQLLERRHSGPSVRVPIVWR